MAPVGSPVQRKLFAAVKSISSSCENFGSVASEAVNETGEESPGRLMLIFSVALDVAVTFPFGVASCKIPRSIRVREDDAVTLPLSGV